MQTDRDAALAELKMLCQSSAAPTLTDEEVGAALDRYVIASLWTAETDYNAGAVVSPSTPNGRLYVAFEALTSGETEPDWPTPTPWPGAGAYAVSDGDGCWRYLGVATASLWDLGAAAKSLWLMKAGKAAGCVDTTAGKVSRKHSQQYDHCLMMAARYGSSGVA